MLDETPGVWQGIVGVNGNVPPLSILREQILKDGILTKVRRSNTSMSGHL